MWQHIRKGRHPFWPSARELENKFNEKHRRIYDQWRCENAGEPPIVEMEILPEETPFFDVNAPLQGVWADTGDVSVDVPAFRPDASNHQRGSPNKMPKAQAHMAMPSDSMASSS